MCNQYSLGHPGRAGSVDHVSRMLRQQRHIAVGLRWIVRWRRRQIGLDIRGVKADEIGGEALW